jgi:DNA-binding LacI/PurR family transcriptional regulator
MRSKNMDSRTRELIQQRRKIALAYRRSQSESDRLRLEEIDKELSRHNIDIPAIQRWVTHRKTGNRHPRPANRAPSGA